MKFKKLNEDFIRGYNVGDKVELANGQTGTVAYAPMPDDERLPVRIDGMEDEGLKFPLIDTVRPINNRVNESAELTFQVGDILEYSGLYGGQYKSKVTKIDGSKMWVTTSWVAEDTGEVVYDDDQFYIEKDDNGNDCIVIWTYHGEVGRVYPPAYYERDFVNEEKKPVTETYWIDNKEVMAEVDKLGHQLEGEGFKYYSDRYSGSTYYNFFTKRGDNGAICKAVQYNYNGAQIIDVTVDQLMGYEPIDSFEKMRRKLGSILLPKNEAIAEGKDEDQFVLYFPYIEPKIISKERAIKQIEFELNNIKNDSGASLAGRGFGIYCLQSVDKDTGTVWTGRYSSKEFLKTISESMLTEDLEDDFDLLMQASELKCKLSRYDIEEANEPSELIMYMKDVYKILVDAYGNENIKWWKFYEDDDTEGCKVMFKDGTKKIVEIVHDRVYEVNESVEQEQSDIKHQYVICGVTNEGTRMLYDAVNDNFTTDYDAATKYDDMDVARDDWFKLPRTGFRRIFIPIYDPAVFESLNEGSGADTAHVASDALKIAAQGDKHQWAKTAADIIDVIPDDFADQMFDAVKSKASEIKLSAENKKKLVDASNGELTEEDVENCDTLGKILALVDGFEWAEKNPGLLKGFVMVVLSIIAIIEPTPALEIVTLIVGFLPAEWVAKALAVVNVVGNPLGAVGTAANKLYKASKKNEAFDADKVQKRIACTTEFDNGHVFHNDYFRASSAEAEERAKQASIENPDKVFYVKYDDVMNPSSDIKWKNGEQLNEADEPIYFDPDDEFEVDFRYFVYANNDDVVSDAFDFEEDAIAWAQENNYPIVKIHNYYRDTDGQLNPDGDPEVIWKA